MIKKKNRLILRLRLFAVVKGKSKIYFENSFQKFGSNKKLVQSLHPQNKDMQRRQLHIETANRFSPNGDYTEAGRVLLHE